MILLDVMLPDCDGFDVCKLLRANPQLAATPIIFVTARTSETDRVIGLELGAVDYIVKPFFLREVVLTATEFRLLEFLMSRPRAVFSRRRRGRHAVHSLDSRIRL